MKTRRGISFVRGERGGRRGPARRRSTSARGTKRVVRDLRKVVKVGVHFGDNKTRVSASKNGDPLRMKRTVFTNIVGFLKLQPLPKTKSNVLCSEHAVKFLQQVDLKKPIQSGLVADVRVCRQFISHLSSAIDPSSNGRLWGVVSIPAVAGPEEWDKTYRSLRGFFQRAVVVPEPYLAAEGLRLDPAARARRLGQDFTSGCLVIDIGAGTTDLCLVRGAFPTPEDQLRLEIAGNVIDDKIFTNALVHSPTLFLSRGMAKEIKEEQAFVGESVVAESPVGEVPVGSDLVALTGVIRRACDKLLQAVTDGACELLRRCSPESGTRISRAVILTGGGSRIRNLPSALEGALRERGFREATVLVPQDYASLVTRGAMRFAEKLDDEEWRAMAWKAPGEVEDASEADEARGDPATGRAPVSESVAWMDVGLRSRADPADGPEESTEGPEGAEGEAQASEAPPASGTVPSPAKPFKKKADEFSAEDLDDLTLFKGL